MEWKLDLSVCPTITRRRPFPASGFIKPPHSVVVN